MKTGSYSIVGALILFTCLCEMRAATVQKIFKTQRKVTTESFKLHIKEGMARFDETIVVDEENDIEYFKVPAHNELSESDNLYDFKMNITVSRVKSDGVCHITPLPQDLPRPNILSRGFKTLTNVPPSHKIVKTIQQWRIGARVEKQSLRPEVQEFCGRFPAYRLEPFTSDSVTVVSEDEDRIRAGKSARTRRQTGTKKFPLCNNNIPQCNPNLWIYECEIRSAKCVYYLTCRLDQDNEIVSCSTLTQHLYTSLVCCTPRCP